MYKKISLSLLFSSLLIISGCASTDDKMQGGDSSSNGMNDTQVNQTNTPDPSTVQYFDEIVGDRVFFETDSSSLNASAQETLQRQAQWLQANNTASITIEGHADERGTREYNIALGARRAQAVYSFLQNLGVNSARLKTISYGKERPVDGCSDESCWSVNRRAVTAISLAQ